MTDVIFGTHNKWQVALVTEGRDVTAAFYDSLDRPNLNGAIATARVTDVRGHRAFVELPDNEEGFIEAKTLPQAGALVVVRITGYVLPGKAWPVQVVTDTPAASVQWHDAAQSVIEHAGKLYDVPQTAMRQDDDAVADFLAHSTSTVELRDGASVVIEQTSALTTVDLNTGRLSGVANYIAVFAPAVAAALQQYNLGGAIAVDAAFLGHQARKGLADKLHGLLNSDPMKPVLVGTTKMGLIEITRPRSGASRLEVSL